MSTWMQLTNQQKIRVFEQIRFQTGLPVQAIEKDWWVVQTLALVFESSIGNHTVFKGGTSLSKAWQLIDRFSEDIDLGLDRKFLGFDKEMTITQVKKLRKHFTQFIATEFFPELQSRFLDAGLTDVRLILRNSKDSDQDPIVLELYYPGLTDRVGYIQPKILIEIGCRSLREPFTPKKIVSLVGEHFKVQPFAEASISIPCVNPERTFLEKIFLLHEEFQKEPEKMRTNRLSRHLYDIEKIMNTNYSETALSNQKLFQEIIEHRKRFTPVRGIDYANHIPSRISFIPPDSIIKEWKTDYETMQEFMIYKDSLPFGRLIDRLMQLNQKINNLNF